MIRNFYYLITGILAILFSFTHAWNGQVNFLSRFSPLEFDPGTRTMIFYVWHIITVENLFLGGALLLMSFQKDMNKVRFAAWMIAFLMMGRWLVIVGSTLLRNRNSMGEILLDSIAIEIFTCLILLGTRKKPELVKE